MSGRGEEREREGKESGEGETHEWEQVEKKLRALGDYIGL